MLLAFLNWLRNVVDYSASVRLSTMSTNRHLVYVHPCVINNQPYVVYPRGLQTQAPKLFKTLQSHFFNQGYFLKEDQRQGRPRDQHQHERRRWAPILLFTTGIFLENTAFAESMSEAHDKALPPHRQVELQLVSSNATKHTADELHVSLLPQVEPASSSPGQASRIYDILMQHYKRNESDPDYILNDFKEIANYYSRFPEVINLLDSIDKKKWHLTYDQHSWVTVASGNAFRVDTASVHFNTRSAAQLKLYNRCQNNPVCIASPADALLHELLHAQSMLVNTQEFLAQGGMNAVLYPYKHEYAIINAERILYTTMSQRDAIKRPQRIDHTGRLVKAQCPTCIM